MVFLGLVPYDISILATAVVWSVVSCRGMCSALQGRCRGRNRGSGLPPGFAELWPKVAGEAGEDVWGGGEGAVLLGKVAR